MRKNEQGSTLVELMIVSAVIGILVAIAVPNFADFRNKSRVAAVIASAEAVRVAFASYAASHLQNLYPETTAIPNFDALRDLVNANGGSLSDTGHFRLGHYTRYASSGGSVEDTYSMRVLITGVPNSQPGYELLITPQGIYKCTLAGDPC